MTTRDEPHTLGRWLADRAAASADAIAVDDRGVTISYGALHARIARLTARLRSAGYGPGDRVCTVSGNSIDHIVAFLACAAAGIAFVPLSWRLTPGELADLLVRSSPALVLYEDEYGTLAADAVRAVAADGGTLRAPLVELGATGVEAHVRRAAARREPRAVRDDDVALVIHTSGSESAAKGVMLTHANCFWNNLALAGVAQLTSRDVVLCVLPQFHVAAWNVQPLLAWAVGATVVLERSFQSARVLQLIADRGVTAMMAVPTQYRLLADDPGFAASDLSSLRLAQVGGSTISHELADAWAARGVGLVQGYGLTEAGPNVLSTIPDQRATALRPYPHVDVLVADPETTLPLDDEATGELWVRGPSVFAGYLGDPDATARAMRGEWLRTGDLVHRDSDGGFHVVDRLKDIYISGGENVAPAEVERALCRHPLVEAAAVVGVPDPVWGERGVAFVVLRAGTAASDDELYAHARRHLAAYKLPVRIERVDELPLSGIGKLARARLRDRATRDAGFVKEGAAASEGEGNGRS
ncbi:class I adenylate-forming enzyme family protein [Microbacterium sp. ASV49]|uniref:AMP-binding protein n=1 Tax=Microbacterium candidum TaxID=3041922 RepID=A0ABT7N0A3_9MICO|nr:AMP-binding protein [Microbacterium sp. ASV49]MDL9980138.1 AMP-binding protein [Microbacterium sp. ASV49]